MTTEEVPPPGPAVGIVVIGRNEGRNLRDCLDSVYRRDTLVVYVDSGSSDGSVDYARSKGVEVVELDMATPFTAARARNAGAARLQELAPDAEFVQFVDGDCTVVDGWLDRAQQELTISPDLGAVFGRRHEIHREASVFNLVCDLEWDSPIGGDTSFGGDVMMRTRALHAVGGFDPTVIASEDRELWLRMRHAGWPTLRIDARMTLHDARLLALRQWWKRCERTGHAYGQISSMHNGPIHDLHHRRGQRRILAWGIALPAVLVATAVPTHGLTLLGLMLYAIPIFRSARHGRARGWPAREALIFASLCVFARLPETVGVLRWHWRRLTGRTPTLIEYKGPETLGAGR